MIEARIDQRTKRILYMGAALFTLGALLGIGLTIAGVWADLEANFYGFDKVSDRKISTLRCPVLMSSQESATISAAFTNPSDTPVEPLIRADISSSMLFEDRREQIRILPGETRSVTWSVTAENIDLGRFIFIKVYQYPASVLPPGEATCGVMVFNFLGLNGTQMTVLALAGSVIGLLGGLFLLERSNRLAPNKLPDFRRFWFIILLVALGIFTSLTGRWLIGTFVLAVIVLAVGSVVGSLVQNSR